MKFKEFLARPEVIFFSFLYAPIFLGNAGFAIFALVGKRQGSDLMIGKELVALVVSLVGSFLIGMLWFGWNALAEEIQVRPARRAVRFLATLALGFVGGAGFSAAGHTGIRDFFSLGSSISILLIGGKALVGEIFVRRGEPQPERTFWIYRNRPLSKMHMIVFFGGLFIAVPGIASGDWIGGLLNVNTATAEMYVKASAAGGAVGGWWWLWLKFLTSENGSRIFHRDRAMPSSTEVGSILNQFPGPVTLYPSRRKWLLVLAGCVLFVVAGLWMVQREAPVGWLGVIFFGMGAIVSTAVLLLRVNALTLDGAGFEINSIRPFRLFWQDAKNFEAITLSPGSWMVGIKVVNPSDRSIFKLNRAISGCDGAIPDTYGLSAYDLTALMTQWRERATATPQRIT